MCDLPVLPGSGFLPQLRGQPASDAMPRKQAPASAGQKAAFRGLKHRDISPAGRKGEGCHSVDGEDCPGTEGG